MNEEAAAASRGPDFRQGIRLDRLVDGEMLLGYVADEPALLVRRADRLFAIGATCPHYGGPLVEGLLVGDTVRCPWHHACFSLRTGAALRPPALNGLPRWRVEQRDGMAFVCEPLGAVASLGAAAARLPASIVIIGGGAAGNTAAEVLRQEGYAGPVTLVSADRALPCDRPNLSKDYLAGTAQADWVSLRSQEFYSQRAIDLKLGTRVVAVEATAQTVLLSDGTRLSYGALLLATGSEPIRPNIPGASLPHVHVLRTLADCDALIASTAGARRYVVVGASFIGLEVAAALLNRGLEVDVVAPERRPMERIMGAAIGEMVRSIHEQHGVRFHLGATVVAIAEDSVTLSSGQRLNADLVVFGVGVRTATSLAEAAGLSTDRGVVVNEFLRTSAPNIYAAGDIARWPDRLTGQRIRVEHWVVAERQGQTAAYNMLGRLRRFEAIPFFWSQHYDTTIAYVGHAERWDRLEIDGDPAARNCKVSFWLSDQKLAVATVGRDLDSLRAEVEFEQKLRR
jgi:3-phenylpropionate/trans-cinnamate dioxygenase ferredoxin reductase subunit